jgi:hypothetical protein
MKLPQTQCGSHHIDPNNSFQVGTPFPLGPGEVTRKQWSIKAKSFKKLIIVQRTPNIYWNMLMI